MSHIVFLLTTKGEDAERQSEKETPPKEGGE
jgi:hypothetical protein